MGYAVRNLSTRWISTWLLLDIPSYDPDTEEIVECGAEDLEGLKPQSQLDAATVPQSVSPWQARKVLRQAGLLSSINSALEAADEETVDAWEYAIEVRRDNPIVAAVAASIGMTSENVDDLFRLAGTL